MTSGTDVTGITSKPRQAPGDKRHQQARMEFERRAMRWLLDQPGRVMRMPQQLGSVVALGVPCPGCGVLVHRDRQDGHRIGWTSSGVGHWAAGVTVVCSA